MDLLQELITEQGSLVIDDNVRVVDNIFSTAAPSKIIHYKEKTLQVFQLNEGDSIKVLKDNVGVVYQKSGTNIYKSSLPMEEMEEMIYKEYFTRLW